MRKCPYSKRFSFYERIIVILENTFFVINILQNAVYIGNDLILFGIYSVEGWPAAGIGIVAIEQPNSFGIERIYNIPVTRKIFNGAPRHGAAICIAAFHI